MLAEQAADVRRGAVSPVELVEAALREADRWQPLTNAFSQLHPEGAIAEAAARAEDVARGRPMGPLHGVPVAVKDLFDVAGWETTGCCAAYRGRLAERDADAVAALRRAGAVILGKTNQHELAAGGTNLVSACGATANPWDRARMTGGSSGGSAAAVAARVVPLALGTDTGGSLRIPASLCGTVALKPTHGALSLRGVMPLAPSMDTVGPMTTSALDAALAFSALGGRPAAADDEASAAAAGGVVVPDGTFVAPVDPQVRAAVEAAGRALAEAGARVVRARGDLRYDPEDWERLAWPALYEAHGQLLDRPEPLGGPTRRFLEYGRALRPEERLGAERRAVALRDAFLRLLGDADAILAPATPVAAPSSHERRVRLEDGTVLDAIRGGVSLLTRPVNMAGLPALSLPAGFTAEGLPVGIQLIGRAGGEGALLRLGVAYQRVTDHHVPAPRAA
ncbi:MAG TPA: amidase [Actinomycetota bacterium]|nr:amidase [Actinomycetota bacterium]